MKKRRLPDRIPRNITPKISGECGGRPMGPMRFHGAAMTTLSSIGCDICGHLACVCGIVANHDELCMFRIAAAGPVGIPCVHGRECCPICDPCTCESRKP